MKAYSHWYSLLRLGVEDASFHLMLCAFVFQFWKLPGCTEKEQLVPVLTMLLKLNSEEKSLVQELSLGQFLNCSKLFIQEKYASVICVILTLKHLNMEHFDPNVRQKPKCFKLIFRFSAISGRFSGEGGASNMPGNIPAASTWSSYMPRWSGLM